MKASYDVLAVAVRRTVFSALALLALQVGWAADPEVAGLVVAVRGEVTVAHADGTSGPLALKDPVLPLDTVKTGERGRVQICFTDDTVLSLGRNTQIQITECVFRRSEGQGALTLNITGGVFRIVGGAIMKIAPENFKAETPTATIGIRGSSFAAQVSASLTTVVLLGTSGAGITVSNDEGYRIVYIPGTGLNVPLGRGPGPVKPMDAVAAALLGLTSVGGVGAEVEEPEPVPQPPVDDGLEGGAVDPHDLIPGYRTDTEARAALAALAAQPGGGQFPMGSGNAVGLDLANGWALRSLSPDEVNVTVGIQGGRLDAVTSGGMILHAQGTGDSADTFPEGPVNAPPIPFTFVDGTIVGNPAVTVTRGTIQPPDELADISNWGWWEMDLTDPNGVAPAHRVVGLWQATSLVRTAADFVRDTLLGRDFVGTYSGDAHCLRNGIDRLDGTSRLALDFQRYAFTGSLDFAATGGPTMDLAGSIGESGIHGRVAAITGEEAVRSSSLRGFFYGARANSIQGAFDAQATANRYIGIFDATGSVSPAAARR
jgi:hypothetical protein